MALDTHGHTYIVSTQFHILEHRTNPVLPSVGIDHLRIWRSGFQGYQGTQNLSFIYELKSSGIYTFYKEFDCLQKERNGEQIEEYNIIEKEM